MKYTEAEVLDIIKCVTDKDPQEVFTTWWSFKPINMKTLLTDDMKTKFETYLINNN